MSIELLPPDKKYPTDWHVRPNFCKCHPETCCCNDWAVYDPAGNKYVTCFTKVEADSLVTTLCSRGQYKAQS